MAIAYASIVRVNATRSERDVAVTLTIEWGIFLEMNSHSRKWSCAEYLRT